VISDNEAEYRGGGLDCSYGSSPTLANCTITGNLATFGVGGACSSHGSTPTLTNCILWGDAPNELYVDPDDPDLAITHSDVAGGYPGEGNIDADPLFRSWRGFDQLLDPLSPCVDAGDPALEDGISDWHPRWPDWAPNGSPSDMGAYGGPGNAGWLR